MAEEEISYGMKDPYRQLAAAIVNQAVQDYRALLVRLYSNTETAASRSIIFEKMEMEEFFQGGWFQELSSLDGRELMRLVQEKAKEDARRRIQQKERKNAGLGRKHKASEAVCEGE